MSCQSTKGSACKGSPQCMVDQRPRYDNQVISRKGIIRPDKRKRKRKYL